MIRTSSDSKNNVISISSIYFCYVSNIEFQPVLFRPVGQLVNALEHSKCFANTSSNIVQKNLLFYY